MGWYKQPNFGDKNAKVKQSGKRVDVIWGGSKGNRRGDGHGHLVSRDGLNATYLREPGGKRIVNDRRKSR